MRGSTISSCFSRWLLGWRASATSGGASADVVIPNATRNSTKLTSPLESRSTYLTSSANSSSVESTGSLPQTVWISRSMPVTSSVERVPEPSASALAKIACTAWLSSASMTFGSLLWMSDARRARWLSRWWRRAASGSKSLPLRHVLPPARLPKPPAERACRITGPICSRSSVIASKGSTSSRPSSKPSCSISCCSCGLVSPRSSFCSASSSSVCSTPPEWSGSK
mmetsp:Transcript_4908/g.13041  ORF Transcript_4908/g.13041 Transcript_4908/m.13041 type:complete len:225 (-) Transcript_4908:218-892(-)